MIQRSRTDFFAGIEEPQRHCISPDKYREIAVVLRTYGNRTCFCQKARIHHIQLHVDVKHRRSLSVYQVNDSVDGTGMLESCVVNVPDGSHLIAKQNRTELELERQKSRQK
jgi:hypothetical protein